jgi:hypothetical protein
VVSAKPTRSVGCFGPAGLFIGLFAVVYAILHVPFLWVVPAVLIGWLAAYLTAAFVRGAREGWRA